MILATRLTWWFFAALLALVAVAQSFLPLFSLMDYEGSIVLAFFTSLFFGAAVAVRVVEEPLFSYLDVLRALPWFLLPALLVKMVGARAWGQCSWSQGFMFFVMYPLMSGVVAGAAGFFMGSVISRGLWAALATIGVVFLSLAWNLYELYAQPVVYSYDPFFGYFSGAFYDVAVEITAAFLWSRVHDTVLAALFVSAAYTLRHGASWLVPALSAMALFGLTTMETRLGFATTWKSLRHALPMQAREGTITLYADTAIPEARRDALFQQILFNYKELHDFFKAVPPRLDVYVFRSRLQKRALFGAENVEIAKPWQHAVFITDENDFPHHSLRHEMAHVFAGRYGDRLFEISFTGTMPNPGLIEGMAVAASFETQSGDYHQRARVLLDLKPDITPDMVFGARFYTLPASQAYTLAGSFIRYLYDTRGPDVVFRIYSSGDFSVLHEPLEKVWTEWKSFLKERISVPKQTRSDAMSRLQRPALHTIPCLHEVARATRKAWLAWDDSGPEKARRILSEALATLPHVPMLLTTCLSLGTDDEVESCAGELRARPEPHLKALGTVELAYQAARRGDFDRARELVSSLGDVPSSLHRRVVLLKLALNSENGRNLLKLLNKRQHPSEVATRLEELGTPLGTYLAGSLYLVEGKYEDAHRAFGSLNPARLPDDEFRCAYLHRAVTAAVFSNHLTEAGHILDSMMCSRSSGLDRLTRSLIGFMNVKKQ